jgi:hypothetical protein
MSFLSRFSGCTRPSERKDIDEESYRRNFGFNTFNPDDESDKNLLSRALNQALEARKFEIEMYWKRATYFWAFIGVAFVGFVTLLKDSHGFSALVLAQIGFVFSLAWHLVNRASKAWQENWENHVELLEDKVIGPLYKTSTKRPKTDMDQSLTEKALTSPLHLSVSKINTLTSAYVVFVWAMLVGVALLGILRTDDPSLIAAHVEGIRWAAIATSLIVTSAFCASFWTDGRSHVGKHTPQVEEREVTIFRRASNIEDGQIPS